MLVLSPRTRLMCNLSSTQPTQLCLKKSDYKSCSRTQEHSSHLIPAISGFSFLSCQSVIILSVPAAAAEINVTPMSQMALLSAYFTNFRDLLAFTMEPEVFLSGTHYRGMQSRTLIWEIDDYCEGFTAADACRHF